MWVKNCKEFGSIEELMRNRSGALFDIESYPAGILPVIGGMGNLIRAIAERCKNGDPIFIITDYDADGCSSAMIMGKTLVAISSGPVFIDVPNRFVDGYGVSNRVIDEAYEQCNALTFRGNPMIILTDNGITKEAEIAYAKSKGFDTVVIDHHLAEQAPPSATVVVDPWVVPGSEFNGYCAGGLCFRVCHELLGMFHPEEREQIEAENLFWAAVATVADMVPILYENRVIVKNGLAVIPESVSCFVDTIFGFHKDSLTTEDVGFTLGPCMNAAGRYGRLDREMLFDLLGDPDQRMEVAGELYELNAKRKDDTALCVKQAEALIATQKEDDKALVLYVPDAFVGVIGIAAGNLAQKYKKPVILLSDSQSNEDEITGSGRSYSGVHLKNALDECSDYLTRYGGHAAAAGLTLHRDSFQSFRQKFLDSVGQYKLDDTQVYDFDVTPDDDWVGIQKEIEEHGPYGVDNQQPVYCVHHYTIPPTEKAVRIMGANNEHLKFYGGKYDAVFFGGVSRYRAINSPTSMKLYGYIKKSVFMGRERIEFEVLDIEPDETLTCELVAGKATALSNRLASRCRD